MGLRVMQVVIFLLLCALSVAVYEWSLNHGRWLAEEGGGRLQRVQASTTPPDQSRAITERRSPLPSASPVVPSAAQTQPPPAAPEPYIHAEALEPIPETAVPQVVLRQFAAQSRTYDGTPVGHGSVVWFPVSLNEDAFLDYLVVYWAQPEEGGNWLGWMMAGAVSGPEGYALSPPMLFAGLMKGYASFDPIQAVDRDFLGAVIEAPGGLVHIPVWDETGDPGQPRCITAWFHPEAAWDIDQAELCWKWRQPTETP